MKIVAGIYPQSLHLRQRYAEQRRLAMDGPGAAATARKRIESSGHVWRLPFGENDKALCNYAGLTRLFPHFSRHQFEALYFTVRTMLFTMPTSQPRPPKDLISASLADPFSVVGLLIRCRRANSRSEGNVIPG